MPPSAAPALSALFRRRTLAAADGTGRTEALPLRGDFARAAAASVVPHALRRLDLRHFFYLLSRFLLCG